MSSASATINDLIEVLEDGTKFYQEALTKVSRPDLRSLFGRMATTKAAIASDLRRWAPIAKATGFQVE